MAVHRSRLPIASPCEGFVPRGQPDGIGGHCVRCDRPVHDLSRMTEPRLRRFLERRLGQQICVAYRVRDDGMLVLPRARGAWAVGALALLLAACAGHMTELRVDGPLCFDAAGYEVVCDDPAAVDVVTVPDEGPRHRRGDDGGDVVSCPVPPPAVAGEHDDSEVDLVDRTVPAEEVEVLDDAEGAPSDDVARVDFLVDPEISTLRGAMVVGAWEDRDFVPTADLVAQAKDRRQSRRERRRRRRQR